MKGLSKKHFGYILLTKWSFAWNKDYSHALKRQFVENTLPAWIVEGLHYTWQCQQQCLQCTLHKHWHLFVFHQVCNVCYRMYSFHLHHLLHQLHSHFGQYLVQTNSQHSQQTSDDSGTEDNPRIDPSPQVESIVWASTKLRVKDISNYNPWLQG